MSTRQTRKAKRQEKKARINAQLAEQEEKERAVAQSMELVSSDEDEDRGKPTFNFDVESAESFEDDYDILDCEPVSTKVVV